MGSGECNQAEGRRFIPQGCLALIASWNLGILDKEVACLDFCLFGLSRISGRVMQCDPETRGS
jgi:hypothetical protein